MEDNQNIQAGNIPKETPKDILSDGAPLKTHNVPIKNEKQVNNAMGKNPIPKPSQYRATIPQPTIKNNPGTISIEQGTEYQKKPTPPAQSDTPLKQVNQKIEKKELPSISKEEDEMFAGMLDQKPTKNNPLSPPPLPNKKPRKIGRLIINVIVLIVLLGGVVYAALIFFNRQQINQEITENIPIVTEEAMEETETPEPEVIDTSSWSRYTSDTLGMTFKHPEGWKIANDSLLSTSTTIGTEKFLHIENNDGTEMLTLWINKEGIEAFTFPYDGLYNPNTASTQLLLINEAGRFTITSKTFQGLSDTVSQRLDTFIAYTPKLVGTKKYIFLLTTNKANGDDLLTKITESADIKTDSDSDGLFDDEEESLGTDPDNPDTDGDTFLDGEEVQNGFNPLGEGRL